MRTSSVGNKPKTTAAQISSKIASSDTKPLLSSPSVFGKKQKERKKTKGPCNIQVSSVAALRLGSEEGPGFVRETPEQRLCEGV